MTAEFALLVLTLAARTIALLLGATIVVVAYRTYRRTKARSMAPLAVGLALVTIGSFIESVLFGLTGLEVSFIHAIESVFVAAGFATIIYAMRAS
jgi:hypothetical protein